EGAWTLVSSSSGPSSRYGAMMSYDAKGKYIVLFGGYSYTGGYGYLNDTWTYSAGNWVNITDTLAVSPEPRYLGAMAYDVKDGYVLLYGGYGVSVVGGNTYWGYFGNTWAFSNGTWTNLTASVSGAPGGMYGNAMAYDAADGYMVLFGGCGPSGCPGAWTWKYSAKTWTSLSPSTHPGARYFSVMTYDPVHSDVLLFGGGASLSEQDTWTFSGGNWTNVSGSLAVHPQFRMYSDLAYDVLDGYAVLYGGYGYGYIGSTYIWTFYNDTWAFGPSIIAVFTVSPSILDLGQSTRLNATPLAFSGYTKFNWSGLPAGCFPANRSILPCAPTQTGSFMLNSTVSDQSGAVVTRSSNLTVDVPPRIASFTTSLSVVTSGSAIYLNTTAHNGTGPFTYGYLGLPGCSSANTSNLKCVPTRPGNYTVKVVVSDAVHGKDNATVALTVNPRPSVQSFVAAPTETDVGGGFDLNVTPAGGTAPYSYSYSGLPVGCATANLSSLWCDPTGQGVYEVGVVVSDGF
ncbi:MAG: hypothetical protein L3K09_09035, partial [Thermoplasmata archaeon]|nr:hypothetical protein [Thermoplasmata archaeon]